MTFTAYLIKIYPLWDGKDLSQLKVPVSQMIAHAEAWAAQNYSTDFWHHTNKLA